MKQGNDQTSGLREALRKLQVQLCHLQRWIEEKGLRVVIVFARDGRPREHTTTPDRSRAADLWSRATDASVQAIPR
jgi:hypothetical protein